MKRSWLVALLMSPLLLAGCKVECNDGTVHERNGKGSVVCVRHGGEKVKPEW